MNLPFLFIGVGAGVLGGVIAWFWVPRVEARSAIQHFAAGVVIAAVASELIPDVVTHGKPWGVLIGFIAGGLSMIALKWVVLKIERGGRSKATPWGLASAAAVDTFVDGAIISAGFASGQRLGVLLVVSLSIELFFLTLSVGSEFRSGGKGKRGWNGLFATTGVAFLLLAGAGIATLLLQDASQPTIAAVLAFGAAALIYLTAEELLVESIEAEESLFSTAMLFAGFAVILAFTLFAKGS